MFLNKINEYKLAQWATRSYAQAKTNYPMFKRAAEKAEQLSAPVIAVIPTLPGIKAIDSVATQTVTRAEQLVTNVHSAAAKSVDASLTAAEKFGEQHSLVSWAVRKPLELSNVVVSNVLPSVNADVKRPAADAAAISILQAIDKHIELVYSLHTRLSGKTVKTIIEEAYHGTLNSTAELAKYAIQQLPVDIQRAINADRKEGGLISYLFRIGFEITKFTSITLPLKAWNMFRVESVRVTNDVSKRAMQEMQEIGNRAVKTADQARETIHRRLVTTTSEAGRTGVEPQSAGEVKKAKEKEESPSSI